MFRRLPRLKPPRRRAPALLLWAALAACGGEESPAPGPPPGEAALARGRAAMAAGRYTDAEAAFRQAYTQGADPHETLLWRIRAHVALGDLEAAREAAVRLTELDPDEPGHRVLLARLQLALGAYDEAWSTIARLVEKAPDRAETALLQVEIHLALGFASRAQHLIEEAERRFPDRPEWAFHRAKADLLKHYVRSARGAHAAAARRVEGPEGYLREGWFSFLLGELDRAEKAYIDAAVHAGDDVAPYSLSSDFYAAIGRYDDAIADLATLRDRLGRDAPDLTRRIATLLVRRGRHEEAQKLLVPYLKHRTEDRVAARELALSYLAQGKLREATATLEVLADRAPDDPDTRYLLGVARLLGRADVEAQAAFEEARRLAPERHGAHLAVAVAALRIGDYFDAEYEARQVLERAPGHLVAGLIFASARKHARQPTAAWLIRERLLARYPDRAETIRKLVPLPESARPTDTSAGKLPPELLDRLLGP